MTNIGVLIETDDNGVKAANYGVVAAARNGGANEVTAFLFNTDGESCKGDLERRGVGRVATLSAETPALKATVLARAARHFEITALLGLSSVRGRDLLARTACELDAPLALDVVGVDLAAGTAKKSHFSGRTMATLTLSGDLPVYGLRPNVFEAAEDSATAEVTAFSPEVEDTGRMAVLDVEKSDNGALDLTEAEIIVTGGRPMDSAENFQILHNCAEALGGAAVGASRAAVDAGFAPHGMQVGQTGKTVSPKLYIGCGLSGSVQHFAGMKTSKVIVGINTDKDAPIFGKCDYGIVGDLFEVAPALTEALKARKG